MKFLALALVLISPVAQANDCPALAKITQEMNQISSNIANVHTTRTPEGGPYKPFINGKQVGKVMLKYEPHHPDANENGYVSYPDIKLDDEMNKLHQASRSFDAEKTICLAGKKNNSVKREPGHSWQAVMDLDAKSFASPTSKQ